MAERPIYVPKAEGALLVETTSVDFQWFPGMASSQKQKSIASLHESALERRLCLAPLEVSSKSEVELGVALSAFNLEVTTKKHNRTFTVETAYQSSKAFQNGGPFTDLLFGTSLAAKKDPRLKESGLLKEFVFFGDRWPLEPKTAFYDWIYLNALHCNLWAVQELTAFDAFTDIEFNPKKSINCQAYAVALYRSLQSRGLIQDVIGDSKAYVDIVSSFSVNNAQENTDVQPRLV